MLAVREHGKTGRSMMMLKLMQEIQSFTISLEMFSINNVILISETEKLHVLFLCLQRERNDKKDIIHNYIFLSSTTNHPSIVLTQLCEKLLILAEGSKI